MLQKPNCKFSSDLGVHISLIWRRITLFLNQCRHQTPRKDRLTKGTSLVNNCVISLRAQRKASPIKNRPARSTLMKSWPSSVLLARIRCCACGASIRRSTLSTKSRACSKGSRSSGSRLISIGCSPRSTLITCACGIAGWTIARYWFGMSGRDHLKKSALASMICSGNYNRSPNR